MAQLIDLVNRAFQQIGAETIDALTLEASPAAALAVNLAQPCVDELLSEHPWRFAKQTRQLSEVAEDMPPDSRWEHQFALPDDFLNVIQTSEDQARWEIFAQPGGNERRLYSNETDVTLDMVIRVEAALFPAYFDAAVVDRLSAKLAMPVTRRPEIADYWRKMAALSVSKAKTLDFNQAPWPEIPDGDFLVNARFG